jgi:nucleoside 2-deoxyribosyltransferase
MKFYYASSTNGFKPHDINNINERIINHLKQYGVVLNQDLLNEEEQTGGSHAEEENVVHNQYWEWLKKADLVVAEVSIPSLGVGYELGRAVEHGKPVLCLFHESDQKLTAMIKGCEELHCTGYKSSEEALKIIDDFVVKVKNGINSVHSIKDINHETVHHLLTGE